MPARERRNKKSGSQNRNPAARSGSKPRSVAELLARSRTPGLAPRSTEVTDWIDFIRHNLPPELGSRAAAAELRGTLLRVTAESAAWSTRLRFALADAAESMRRQRPQIERVEVRVAPAGKGR